MREYIHGSFRDPDSYIFKSKDGLFRKVLPAGMDDYDSLMSSGLYKSLIEHKYLVSHEEISRDDTGITIRPEKIPFISYPYEWCFSQLKDAALLTLKIQNIAMAHGMSLKDASAYNVQFSHGSPIFIDTMSFEKLNSELPWVAYRQFCQHFLAPLALMALTDIRLNKLMAIHIDGIPLDMTSKLLPFKSRLSIGHFLHIHLHAKLHNLTNISVNSAKNEKSFSLKKMQALISHLESLIKKLSLGKVRTEWAEYYSSTNYSNSATEHKSKIISSWLDEMRPLSLVDLGSNDGSYTKLASRRKIFSIAADVDPLTIENCYTTCKLQNDQYIMPLLLDLTNPSASIGWHNKERDSFFSRIKADCTMALALIHHITIANNVPLDLAVQFFSTLSQHLIIEFVPKSDSMVQKMLNSRKDVFQDWHVENFEHCFSKNFIIRDKKFIPESDRVLYWMEKIH